MQKNKQSKHIATASKASNVAFVEKLQALAVEQKKLMEHSVFPNWFGPLNAAVAENAFPFVLILSGVVSMAIFLWFFEFFFDLGRKFV